MGEPVTSPLRVGLIGCGRIGAADDERTKEWPGADRWLPYSHAAAISSIPGLRLEAVCDVDPAAARAAADRWHVPAWYVDYNEMLERERLDVVSIATRTGPRPAIIERVVEAGVKGLYCEKPLSNTLEDADRVAAVVNQRAVRFAYGTKRRYMRMFIQVREAIEQGRIGEPRAVVASYGTASLFWVNPHAVDLLSFFALDAPAAWVQAALDMPSEWPLNGQLDADPVVQAGTIRYRNGIVASLNPVPSNEVVIVGSKGTATIREDTGVVGWREMRPDGWLSDETIEHVDSGPSGTANAFRELCEAVQSGARTSYSVDLAVRNQEILFGFVYSHAAGGQRVACPLSRRGLRITGRVGDLLA